METRFEFRDFLKVFGLAIVFYVLFASVLTSTPGIDNFFSTLHPSISFLLEYLLQFVIFFCPLWIFVVGKYNATTQDFGFKKVSLKKLIQVVLLSYLGYLFLNFCLSILLSYTSYSLPGYESQESYLTLFGADVWGIVVGFLLVGVLAPCLEEVLFRGFVYRIFVKTWPLWFGSVLSAALFALVHVQFQTFIPLFILGLLLNHAYQKTNSIWTSIVLHSLNNILAFAVEVYLSSHPVASENLAQLGSFLYTIQIG